MRDQNNQNWHEKDLEAKYYLEWAFKAIDELNPEPFSDLWVDCYDLKLNLSHLVNRIKQLESRVLSLEVNQILVKHGI